MQSVIAYVYIKKPISSKKLINLSTLFAVPISVRVYITLSCNIYMHDSIKTKSFYNS